MQRLIFDSRSYHWLEKLVAVCLTLLVSVSVVLALASKVVLVDF